MPIWLTWAMSPAWACCAGPMLCSLLFVVCGWCAEGQRLRDRHGNLRPIPYVPQGEPLPEWIVNPAGAAVGFTAKEQERLVGLRDVWREQPVRAH